MCIRDRWWVPWAWWRRPAGRSRGGAFRLLELAVAVNLSLALFNLLPIPALDGGRILLLVLSRFFRIRPEQEAAVHYLGFLFLILLVLLVTFQDLRRLLGG